MVNLVESPFRIGTFGKLSSVKKLGFEIMASAGRKRVLMTPSCVPMDGSKRSSSIDLCVCVCVWVCGTP